MLRAACRLATLSLFVLACYAVSIRAQTQTDVPNGGEKLQFAVYLNRHGVRSPTGKAGQYNAYSAAPWPDWDVPPGYLTAHGFQLMKLFGAYDRAHFAAEGLIAPAGCADAAHVTVLADSDQRTRETGEALAEGMFPGCAVGVHAQADGDPDALFHAMHAGVGKADRALALAAIEGGIGGNAGNLTEAYRPQLDALDKILAGCGRVPATNTKRTSIFDTPASEAEGRGDHAAELRGPLTVASSLAESLLLEYTQGMKGADLGWGCLDEAKLREVMQLHTAAVAYTERTPFIARMYASNLLEHILEALEQRAAGKALAGAPGKPGDRVLFLVGHDTNIATVAGMLNLHWIVDGMNDGTPPGGTLVFELWRARTGAYSVRAYYTAQALDQMREATPLTLADPPERVPVFVPDCSRRDLSCPLNRFAATVHRAMDVGYNWQ
jgi:4-phytase/acid phosphatase